MITKRPDSERGETKTNWLDSRHSFSFNRYYDPEHTQFRALRVINEDWVAAGRGFDMHPHRDMEIITYVLEGALQHRDSTGGGGVIRPGDVQRMSAGTGIVHGEFNASEKEPVHLLQIWLLPERNGLKPSYEQKTLGDGTGLRRIAGPKNGDGAVILHQDAEVYSGKLGKGEKLEHSVRPGRHAWVQVARGKVAVNGVALDAGDGAAVSDEKKLVITSEEPKSEILLFDLA